MTVRLQSLFAPRASRPALFPLFRSVSAIVEIVMIKKYPVTKSDYRTMASLLAAVRSCRACESHLPHGPRPVLRAAETSRILIVGQAPGMRVHTTGIPWDDASGERLRG
jgi:hypothetical protein